MYEILLILLGYLYGSIPFALVIGKVFYNTDVRESGSGNLGEKKIGSLEKRHGIVEKSLVEYVSCGKLSVRKDDEGCIRIIFLIYMELW